MTARQTLYVIGATLAIIVVLFFTLFEFREVIDAKWQKHYRYTSKDPYGTLVMKELIDLKYGIDQVINASDTIFESIDTSGYLYLFFGNYLSMDSAFIHSLYSFLHKGNEALFISNYLYQYTKDTTGYSYNCVDIYQDTAIVINNTDDSEPYIFKHYYDDFETPSEYSFNVTKFNCGEDPNTPSPIFLVQDSMTIFYRRGPNNFQYYYHSVPVMFTNVASKQEYFLDHFNDVFGHFKSDKIIVDHYTYNRFQSVLDESPIQFILSDKSLSWAYYSMLALVSLFVIFRGKRLQKIIPLTEPNRNTSLDYVKTLSRLHFSQNQNHKLVLHLREIFFQKVKSKYYIEGHESNFAQHLSDKSKVSIEEIEIILARFQNAVDHFQFNDGQLSKLHNRLENLYKKWQ